MQECSARVVAESPPRLSGDSYGDTQGATSNQVWGGVGG